MNLRRRPRPGSDPAHLERQLEIERAHSADLAEKLADRDELVRHMAETRDWYRGRNRELTAEVLNLKAELRERAS